MRTLGIVLIIVGIIMFFVRSLSFTHTEKVVDAGPIEINKKENKTVGWPMYAGGVAVVAGILLVIVDRKKPDTNENNLLFIAVLLQQLPACTIRYNCSCRFFFVV